MSIYLSWAIILHWTGGIIVRVPLFSSFSSLFLVSLAVKFCNLWLSNCVIWKRKHAVASKIIIIVHFALFIVLLVLLLFFFSEANDKCPRHSFIHCSMVVSASFKTEPTTCIGRPRKPMARCWLRQMWRERCTHTHTVQTPQTHIGLSRHTSTLLAGPHLSPINMAGYLLLLLRACFLNGHCHALSIGTWLQQQQQLLSLLFAIIQSQAWTRRPICRFVASQNKRAMIQCDCRKHTANSQIQVVEWEKNKRFQVQLNE